jgi:hypothetical protein
VTKRLLFFFTIAISGTPLFSQNPGEKEALREVLMEIEKRYDITFTYADQNIDKKTLVPPSESVSLKEVLEYLASRTGLNFRQLNDRFVAISEMNEPEFNICGYVFDGQTGKIVSGATIQVRNQLDISDEQGYFELNHLRKSDTAMVRFLGYEIAKLSVEELGFEGCGKIFLRQKVIKLREIIITNFIAKGINVNSDGSFIINAQSLGILPGLTDPDVLQTIQALPGIQSINETVSDINVRGGTNDQNLIFWDGIKMYQSGHFFGLISAFNPYLTRDVVLIKNGTTAALSDGVSSTIDIRTSDQVSETFSGGAGVNMLNADLFLKVPIARNVSIHLSGRHSISDLVQTPTYQQYFNRAFRNTDVTISTDPVSDSLVNSDEEFKFYDVSAKLLYDISPKDRLRINFLKVFNTINYEENAMIGNEPETKTSGLDQGSLGSGLSYGRTWTDQLTTNLQLYYSDYDLRAVNFDVLKDQRLIQENRVVDTGLKLDARIALHNTFDLYTGYQFYETGVSNLVDINNPLYRRLVKKVLRSHAIFAEGNYSSISGNTNLRVGLRANYFEKYGTFLPEPRLAFTQRFHKTFCVEILGEIKSQATTQIIDLQNDFLGVEKRRWILANEDDIPIVKSKQASVGFRYHPGSLLISLQGYLKEVDGITSSSQGFQNQFQYIRTTGSYDVGGIDFLINQRLGNFNSWFSYSYAENYYLFPELSPSVFPNNLDIRHTATFGSSYSTSRFQVSAGVNWRTGKPMTLATQVTEGEIMYEEPNSSRLDDYLRVDLSAKYMFKISNHIQGEFGASIWNLLDRKNIVNVYFQLDKDDNLETIRQGALGFTPNFMFRVSF